MHYCSTKSPLMENRSVNSNQMCYQDTIYSQLQASCGGYTPTNNSAAAMHRQTLTMTAFAAYSNNKELRKLSGLFETSNTWTATKMPPV